MLRPPTVPRTRSGTTTRTCVVRAGLVSVVVPSGRGRSSVTARREAADVAHERRGVGVRGVRRDGHAGRVDERRRSVAHLDAQWERRCGRSQDELRARRQRAPERVEALPDDRGGAETWRRVGPGQCGDTEQRRADRQVVVALDPYEQPLVGRDRERRTASEDRDVHVDLRADLVPHALSGRGCDPERRRRCERRRRGRQRHGRCSGGRSQGKPGRACREREPQAGRMVMVTSVRSLHVWSSLTCPLLPAPVKFTSESASSCSSWVTV